jgi:hypothetical protein
LLISYILQAEVEVQRLNVLKTSNREKWKVVEEEGVAKVEGDGGCGGGEENG